MKEYCQLQSSDKNSYFYPDILGLCEEVHGLFSSFLKDSLQQSFVLEDYRELAYLTLILVIKGSEPKNFVMKHPSALRKAR